MVAPRRPAQNVLPKLRLHPPAGPTCAPQIAVAPCRTAQHVLPKLRLHPRAGPKCAPQIAVAHRRPAQNVLPKWRLHHAGRPEMCSPNCPSDGWLQAGGGHGIKASCAVLANNKQQITCVTRGSSLTRSATPCRHSGHPPCGVSPGCDSMSKPSQPGRKTACLWCVYCLLLYVCCLLFIMRCLLFVDC